MSHAQTPGSDLETLKSLTCNLGMTPLVKHCLSWLKTPQSTVSEGRQEGNGNVIFRAVRGGAATPSALGMKHKMCRND